MASKNRNADPWESQARLLLAPLAEQPPKPKPNLTDDVLDQVYASISMGDILEFSTTVLVREHLGVVIAAVGPLLVDRGRTSTHD